MSYEVWSVCNGKVTPGADVVTLVDGIGRRAVVAAGNIHVGGVLSVMPVHAVRDVQTLSAATVERGAAGAPLALRHEAGARDMSAVIVAFRTVPGVGGDCWLTGDRAGAYHEECARCGAPPARGDDEPDDMYAARVDAWHAHRHMFAEDPGERLMTGYATFGVAGGIYGGQQSLRLLHRCEVVREVCTGRSLRLPVCYYMWDGASLIAMGPAERDARQDVMPWPAR